MLVMHTKPNYTENNAKASDTESDRLQETQAFLTRLTLMATTQPKEER